MWWLWIIGPIAAGLVFVLTGQVDQHALNEIDAWREQLGARRAKNQKKAKAAGEGKKKKLKDTLPKPTGALSRDFAVVVEEIGEGRVVGQYELVPKVAYARFVTGDIEGSSDHQTVLVRLAEPGPAFTASPLPLLEENSRLPNTGIEFRKDPEFFSTYLVQADATFAKAIGKWLSRDLRQLMREHGDVWVCVRGRSLALTVYGPIRADKIAALVDLAEVFVAEHGAEDGPSIFGEADHTSVKEKHDDVDDVEEDDDASNDS